MKRITTVFGVCMLLFFAGSVLAQNVSEKRQYTPRNEQAVQERGIAGALEYYQIVRGNPDVSDIVNAHKQADLLPKGKSMTWSPVGPDNMGGRTRALLIDRNDVNTIYAGGVAGGLWKSTTGGTSWELINPLAENYAISCITQDINGVVYFGTGEGFGVVGGTAAGSTSFIGGGIFKATDATNTSFSVLSATEPLNYASKWAFIYEMAADPNSSRVYAATDGGLYMTDDGGTTWTNPVLYPASNPYTLVSHDIEVASDGSVYVVVGDKVFHSPNGNTGTYTEISISGTSAASVGRIELAVAPTDPNYIYASVARNTGALFNVYRSTNAGATWTIIGPGGSANFNVFGDNNQGYWNNIIKVFPDNKDHILVGGIDLWDWSDGGTWIQKSLWYLESSSSYYLHADQHDIVFEPGNSQKFYHASDGGVSKSTDAGTTFSTVNRKYATIQFYNISCNAFDMVLGGTQDNGTILIPNLPDSNQSQNGIEFLGGDGGWSAMSYIDPNVIVGTLYNGDMYRSDELGNNPNAFYSDRILGLTTPPGESGFSGFVTPLLLDEDIYNYNSPDSITGYATTTIPAGSVVTAYSHNNFFPFTFTVPYTLNAGDSIRIQDIVTANFFLGATGAVWMTRGIHDFSGAPDWYKISTISGTAQSMAMSDCGNYLFVGTSGGALYRISNILFVKDSVSGDVTSAQCVVETKLIASTGRAITSISVDPTDASNVLYTLGEYGQSAYVYYSTNALDETPTFSNKSGNLPDLPVYASVIELHNPSTVILGTELGVFTSTNITAASPSWVEDNGGMGRVPVYSLRQQTLNYPGATNYGVIYAGSHGRGAFKSMEYVGLADFDASNEQNLMTVYPNPAVNEVHLQFVSEKSGDVIVSVLTVDGKLVSSQVIAVQFGSNEIELNVAGLKAGNYLVEVRNGSAVSVGKIVKN